MNNSIADLISNLVKAVREHNPTSSDVRVDTAENRVIEWRKVLGSIKEKFEDENGNDKIEKILIQPKLEPVFNVKEEVVTGEPEQHLENESGKG
jgi:hypothetical protein